MTRKTPQKQPQARNRGILGTTLSLTRQFPLNGFLPSVLSLIFLLLFSSSSFAAPHLTRLKPEPAVRPGIPFAQRVAKKFAPANAMLAPAAYLYNADILFLKVDFPSDSDTATTGNGTWNDPTYATLGDPNYWLSSDISRFISYYNEVSYGKLTINVVESALSRM
ncbi:MAG: hypothetical protein OEW15_18415, partial [Nitrospirota bacterium]|nr:hypothetical protein [Nitrospirota bacterium]